MSLRPWLAGVICTVLLSGCVSYRLGIDVNWFGGGRFEQMLEVDRALIEAGGPRLERLLAGLERRTVELGGRAERRGGSLTLQVPFTDSSDLEHKINGFLGRPLVAERERARRSPPVATLDAAPATPVSLARASEPLSLVRTDRWLWSEYELEARLDLRTPLGSVVVPNLAAELVRMEFALSTPLPALRTNADVQQGNTLVWQIRPGTVNRLQASFVVPNLAALAGFTFVGGPLLLIGLGRRRLGPRRLG